jgi:hypothetical protein
MSERRRLCSECGQELFPNYMEGCWEHFASGCRFTGKAADFGWPNEQMLGPLAPAGGGGTR